MVNKTPEISEGFLGLHVNFWGFSGFPMAKLSEESALGFPRAMAPQHFAEMHRQGDLLPGSLRSVVMEEMVRRQRTKGGYLDVPGR